MPASPSSSVHSQRVHSSEPMPVNSPSPFASALQQVLERMRAACERAGRSFDEVNLLLATKTVPAERLPEALLAGQVRFGENRVQEGLAKSAELAALAPELARQARWELIGHLQTNKVNQALRFVRAIHSVDRLRLVNRLENRLAQLEQRIDVHVQVNTSGEASKYGVAPEEAEALVTAVQQAEHLNLLGLMTIGRLGSTTEAARPDFAALRQLRDRLMDRGLLKPEQNSLSMGMSGDLEVAIEEGATLIRVGTAVFGQRPTPDSYYWPSG